MLGVAMSRVIFFLSINTTGHVVLCIFCIHSSGPPRLNSKSIVKRNFLELEKTILYSQQDDELFVYERGRQTARKINTQSNTKADEIPGLYSAEGKCNGKLRQDTV